MVVVVRMVYRGAPAMKPVDELQNTVRVIQNRELVASHLLVTLEWAEICFSNKIFAVIGAFDVDRVREELVINVP